MKILKRVLAVVAIGLLIGLVGLGFESLVDWVLHDVIPHWVLVALGLVSIGIAALLVLGFIVAGVTGQWEAEDLAPRRIEALHLVHEALDDYARMGQILTAEDGSFIYALVALRPGQWTPAFPFYNPGVANQAVSVSPYNESLYWLLLAYQDGKVTVVPIPFGCSPPPELRSYYQFLGLRKWELKTLVVVNSLAAEVDYFKLPITSVCVGAIEAIEARGQVEWTKFLQKLDAWAAGGRQGPAPEPKGFWLSHMTIEFKVAGWPGLKPLYVELDRDFQASQQQLLGLIHSFSPFGVKIGSVLQRPYEPE
jgi:hypothetical protein